MSAPRDDRGFAMVMAVIIMGVMATLAILVLTNGSHADRASGRGENWNSALHVSEAGVEEAMALLAENNGVSPGAFTGSVTDGDYSVQVTPLGRNHYQVDSVGHVGSAQSLEAERGVRVVIAPPPSFKYALFSTTDVNTKNTNDIYGDIWANGSVTVYNGDRVEGSVSAADGYVHLNQNSVVTGDVHTGAYDAAGNSIWMDLGTSIGGDAMASSTTPDCSDDPGRFYYKIDNSGSIAGTATLWGNIFGSGAVGALQSGVCTLAPAAKTIPNFVYNPLNYDPAPSEYDSVADFQAWLDTGTNKTNFTGVHYVEGSGVVDLDGVVVAGDAAVIAVEAAISAEGGSGLTDVNDGTDKVLVLATWYQPPPSSACVNSSGNPEDCSIGIKNNFEPDGQTATLLYAPNGPCAFKNSADFFGAVYCNDIVLKNNMTLIYDARVEQIVGFGDVTLEVESFLERPVDQLTVTP